MTTETTTTVWCECGSTSWEVGETSLVYQRCTIDTADDDIYPDAYDSGDIDTTWAKSVDFARCAECGEDASAEQQDALEKVWRVNDTPAERVATILTAAGHLREAGLEHELIRAIEAWVADFPAGITGRELGTLLPR
jgi:hypothetical protein